MNEAKYKRVLLKLSGEALAGEKKTGLIRKKHDLEPFTGDADVTE